MSAPHKPTVDFLLDVLGKVFDRELLDSVAAAVYREFDGHEQPAAAAAAAPAPASAQKEVKEKQERKPRANLYTTYMLFSNLISKLFETSDSFKHSLEGTEGQRGNVLRHAGRLWSTFTNEEKDEFASTYAPLRDALNEESRTSSVKCPNLTQRVAQFDASLGHPYNERILAAAALLPPADSAASGPADGEGEAATPASVNKGTPAAAVNKAAPAADASKAAATNKAAGAPGSAVRAAPVTGIEHAAAGPSKAAEAPAAAAPDSEHKRKRKNKDKKLEPAGTPEKHHAPAVAAAAAAAVAQPSAVAEAALTPAADGLEGQTPGASKKEKRKRLKLEAAQRAMEQA